MPQDAAEESDDEEKVKTEEMDNEELKGKNSK